MRIVKKCGLALAGCLLLAVGYAMNSWMTAHMEKMPPLVLINLIVLAVWVLLGLLSQRVTGSLWEAMLLVNAAALIDLVLVVIQVAFVGRFWGNWLGAMTQFYYLPVVRIPSQLCLLIFRTGSTISSFFAAFASLCAATALGHRLGQT